MPPPIDTPVAPAAPAMKAPRPPTTITPQGNTPGYNPQLHHEQITANWPKPQPVAVHRLDPAQAARPSAYPHLEADVASYRANAQAINRRQGDGDAMMRRASDMLRPPETVTAGRVGADRSGPDFSGQRFNQAQAPPHAGPVAEPGSTLPGTHEDLDAMIARMGLGRQPEPGGLGSGIRRFMGDESGAAIWPPSGKPGGYDVLPAKPATPIKPAKTGRAPGPVPMVSGPAPKTKPVPDYPNQAVAVAQDAHEVRLGRQTAGAPQGKGDVSGFANRGPDPRVRAAASAPVDGMDLAGMRALHAAESPAAPVPQTASEPIWRDPMYNPKLHGTPENYASLRAQAAALRNGGVSAPAPAPAPMPTGGPSPFVPPPSGPRPGVVGRIAAAAPRAAAGVGVGAMVGAAADPTGFAHAVGHPWQTAANVGDAIWQAPGRLFSPEFARGAGRLAGGDAEAWHALNAGANPMFPVAQAASNLGRVGASALNGTLGRDTTDLMSRMSAAFNAGR